MTPPTRNPSGRLDARPWPASVLLYGLLLLCTAITLLPYAWMLSSSFKPTVEIFSGTAQLIPSHPIFDNYINAVTRQPVARAIFNSIIVAGIETFAVLVTSVFTAYLFAKVGIDFADHQARFGALLRIAAKDIALGHHIAQRSGAQAQLIAHAAILYETALEQGFGDADQLAFTPATRRGAAQAG